jgi:hypothetical protein
MWHPTLQLYPFSQFKFLSFFGLMAQKRSSTEEVDLEEEKIEEGVIVHHLNINPCLMEEDKEEEEEEEEEEDGLGAFGLHSEHPMITQHILIELYKLGVKYCRESSRRSTPSPINLLTHWEEFQNYFEMKPITEVITKSKSGKFILFFCPEKIRALITPAVDGKYNIPDELIKTILSQLIDPSLLFFAIYQGKVINQNISLKKILFTSEINFGHCPDEITFPRYLLLDENFSVLSLSDKSFEYFSSLSKEIRSLPFMDLDLIPNSFLPPTSQVFKFIHTILVNLDKSDGGGGLLISQQDYLFSLYDDSWLSYLLALHKMGSNSSFYYVKLILQVVSGILLLPKLRCLPRLVEQIVENLISLNYLTSIVQQYLLANSLDQESLSLLLLCLKCSALLCQFSENYAAYLVTCDIPRLFVQIIDHTLHFAQAPDSAVISLINDMKLVVLNSPERQLLFINSGVHDCLDRCLLKYESLIRKDVILFNEALGNGSSLVITTSQKIYLPPWLLLPFADSGADSFENLVFELKSSNEKESLTLATALVRSRKYGISSLIDLQKPQPIQRKVALRITNDLVFSPTSNTSLMLGEMGNKPPTELEANLNINRQLSYFLDVVKCSKWLRDYWTHLATHVASTQVVQHWTMDEIVRCYPGDTGRRAVDPFLPRWSFVYAKIDYFSYLEPLFEDEVTPPPPILIPRGLPLDCSLSGSAWKILLPSHWTIIQDDIYLESEHNTSRNITKVSSKKLSELRQRLFAWHYNKESRRLFSNMVMSNPFSSFSDHSF